MWTLLVWMFTTRYLPVGQRPGRCTWRKMVMDSTGWRSLQRQRGSLLVFLSLGSDQTPVTLEVATTHCSLLRSPLGCLPTHPKGSPLFGILHQTQLGHMPFRQARQLLTRMQTSLSHSETDEVSTLSFCHREDPKKVPQDYCGNVVQRRSGSHAPKVVAAESRGQLWPGSKVGRQRSSWQSRIVLSRRSTVW